MKHLITFLILISSFSCVKEIKTEDRKEIVSKLCNEFSKQYSENNSFEQNQILYLKNVEIKLIPYDSNTKDQILRKLHELCPSLLEYSTLASRIKASNEGRNDAYDLWDKYINSKNNELWTENEKKQFLDICNYALAERKNSDKICKCTIDKISEKLSAEYFLSLSTNEQGYLGGQISYVFCVD